MFRRPITIASRVLPDGVVGDPVRSKQRSLLRLLSVAHSQRLDLQTMIENLSVEYPDSYGRKLDRFGKWIAAGSALGTALSHVPGVLEENDALILQCAIDTDSVDEAFQLLLSQSGEDTPNMTSNIIRNTLCYFGLMLLFAIGVITFLMLFIIPMLKEVVEEFSLALPGSMSALTRFADAAAVYVPFALLALLGFGILLMSHDFRRFVWGSWIGRLLPTTRLRRTAGLLRLLSLPTESGRPIGPTLIAAAGYHPDRRYRRRLLTVRSESRSDADAWTQLANQNLLSSDQGDQIRMIEQPSTRAWALRTLADRTEERSRRFAETLARLAENVPSVLVGLLVGWIAIAMVQTLAGLISSLA